MSTKQNVSITILSIIIVFLIVMFSSLIFLKSRQQFSFILPRPDTANTTSNYPNVTIPSLSICESPECVTLAQKLLNYRDESIDPCHDFYGFVCGKYHEHSIADNSIKEKSIIISRLIKEFLLKNESSTSKSEIAMKLLFDKCEELNDPFAEDSDNEAYREIYKDIQGIGSFPFLEEGWDASKFNLNEVLSKISELGITDFGVFEISVSSKNIKIKPSARGSLNPVGIKKMLHKLFEINELDFDDDKIMKDVIDVYNLDVRLKNISETQETSAVLYSVLKQRVPSVNFDKIIRNFITPKKKDHWEVLENKITIYQYNLFFGKLDNLEYILRSTPSRTVANYLIIRFLESSISKFVPRKLIKCEEIVIKHLGYAALRFFIRNHFNKENLKDVIRIVEETRNNFIEMIQESNWLNGETKRNAILKVKNMKAIVGYPDEFEKEGALDKLFERLDVTSFDSYPVLLKKVRKFNLELQMEYLASKTTLDVTKKWFETNAYYSPAENSISESTRKTIMENSKKVSGVLAPFMDEPLFDSTYPNFAKIAILGRIIGHEMGHGLDPMKIKEGSADREWWNKEDTVEYERRVQCLIEEYNQYDDPDFGKRMDGSKVINEVVAEMFGAEVAWRSFETLNLSEETRLVTLSNYSIPKLFFEIIGVSNCKQRLTGDLDFLLELATHPTSSFQWDKNREMSIKEKCSNPLLALVIFLVVTIIVILTTVVILRYGDNKINVGGQEAWVAISTPVPAPRENTSRPQTPDVSTVPPKKVCDSDECIHLTHQLRNWADPSIDPCVDFYQSACGRYGEFSTVEGTRNKEKQENVKQLIIEILRKTKKSDSKSENVMLTMYHKCMQFKGNEEFLELHEQIVLPQVLADIKSIGSWPLLDKNWDESKFDLNGMLSNIARLGKTRVAFIDVKMPTGDDVLLIPFTAETRPSYKKTAWKILNITDVDVDPKLLDKDFEDVEDLFEELRDDSKEQTTEFVGLNELQKQIPLIDFKRIVESWINPKRKHLAKNVYDNLLVPKSGSLFFDEDRNLNHILKETPKRVLANYLIFQYIAASFQSMSIGETIVGDRDCEEEVISRLQQASLHAFKRRYIDKENRKLALELAENIRKNFIETIQDSTWLHGETKKKAILKVEKMKKMIGYPDEYAEEGAFDKTFESLNVLPTDSYYLIMTRVKRFETEELMDFLAGVTTWNPLSDPLAANALYKPFENSVTVLLPFLDDPLFDSSYPSYARIAGTGATIAHEMGHGLDPDSMKNDENGKPNDWWTPEDKTEYNKRVQCLIDQYNDYDDPDFGKQLNGTVTQHEMFADAVGAETAWRAFKKLDLSKTSKFIGLDNISIEKLYFRVAALDYCNRPDDLT
ncbi:hypothetical protein CAEBREN_29093 [Caenorhabditis brenneri]|uniref:Uncharacterized protein n=1 Tax=Caenorhabditis brenneri TaxID=135651 RepID=G0P629_CAEBE|nr:hypothetical protein CAEBREN_29093 [Caenorhabditis brenneri]